MKEQPSEKPVDSSPATRLKKHLLFTDGSSYKLKLTNEEHAYMSTAIQRVDLDAGKDVFVKTATGAFEGIAKSAGAELNEIAARAAADCDCTEAGFGNLLKEYTNASGRFVMDREPRVRIERIDQYGNPWQDSLPSGFTKPLGSEYNKGISAEQQVAGQDVPEQQVPGQQVPGLQIPEQQVPEQDVVSGQAYSAADVIGPGQKEIQFAQKYAIGVAPLYGKMSKENGQQLPEGVRIKAEQSRQGLSPKTSGMIAGALGGSWKGFDDVKNMPKGLHVEGAEVAEVAETTAPDTTEGEDGLSFWSILKDLTVDSVSNAYANSSRAQRIGSALSINDMETVNALMQQPAKTYDHNDLNWLERGVRGASEMIGQWGREFTDPTSQAAGLTAMTVAGVAGQVGPQVVLPEEVISVPTAYFTGLKVGGIKAALEIEAGYAYEEMVRAGVSPETAKDIALTVGAFNALLNVVELDELGKGIKALSKGGKSAGNSALLKVLTQFGINVGKEAVVEVAQEGVTIAGVNAGKRIEGIETDSWGEITNRLWDTGTQSALSFGFFNLPGAIKGGFNTNLQGKGNVATAKVAGAVYDINKLNNTENFRNGSLRHVLEGDVKPSGSVSGYHYEGMPSANTSTVSGTASTPNAQGVYTAQVVGKTGNGGVSTFFPQNMTPQQIVDSINEAYSAKVFITGNTYVGTTSSGMTIEMYIDSVGKIISAFPKY